MLLDELYSERYQLKCCRVSIEFLNKVNELNCITTMLPFCKKKKKKKKKKKLDLICKK